MIATRPHRARSARRRPEDVERATTWQLLRSQPIVWPGCDLGRSCPGPSCPQIARGQRPGCVAPCSLDPVDVVAALVECGGAASWRRLRRLGVTWHSLWVAVLVERVVRVRRGAYALPDADAARTATVRLGGVLSCTSAARLLGLPVLFDTGLHVTVPRSWGHATASGVRVHRRDLRSDEHDGVCTSLLRTVLDCARELPLREALVVCDAALRAGLSPEGLRCAADAARGRGSTALRRVASLADGRAESPIESCLRLLAGELGRVRPQVWIDGVGRVDLLLDGWLVLEADGFEFHATRAHYREDRRRANALAERGYVLLRFTYEDVVHRPGAVVETLVAVLARRGLAA